MHVGSRHVGPPRLTYIRIEEKKEPDDEELKKKNRMEWMMKTTQKGKERHLRAGQGRQGTRHTSGLIKGVLRTIDTNTGISYLSEH